MQIALRSPLAAGTTAAVAATLVIAPVGAALPELPVLTAPSVAAVTLAAFNSPFGQLIQTAEQLQNYIFGDYYYGADGPTFGAGAANWPYAGFQQNGGDYLNWQLTVQKRLGNYSAVGIIPQRINDAEPIQQQLQTDLSDYVNVALTGATSVAAAIDTGIWTFPPTLLTAAQLAIGGDIAGAIEVLRQAIVTPITQATEAVVQAASYIVTSVITKLVAVVQTIPQIVTTFVAYAVRGLSYLAQQSVQLGTTWVNQLTSGDIEGAWNTAVDGLLGPSGLPGSVINLNLGPGVMTGPILTPADIETNFSPSLRTAVLGALWTVQDALATTPPPPAAEQAEAPSAAAARTAEPAESGATESAAASADDSAAPARSAAKRGSAEGSRANRANRADRADRADRTDRAHRDDKAGAQESAEAS